MAKLKWIDAGIVECNGVSAILNRSIQENANVFYSVRVGRNDETGKISQYLRVEDLDNLPLLATTVKAWIKRDIDKIREAKT